MKKKHRPDSYLKVIGNILLQALISGVKKGSMMVGQDQLEDLKRMMEGGKQ